jgi:hypothetical protein
METIWFMWAVAFVLVITGKNEAATTRSACRGGTAFWAASLPWRSMLHTWGF